MRQGGRGVRTKGNRESYANRQRGDSVAWKESECGVEWVGYGVGGKGGSGFRACIQRDSAVRSDLNFFWFCVVH